MDLRLTGRVALVTGASQGIGAATARTLAAEGVLVVGGSRTSPPELPPGVVHVPVDLTERGAAERLVTAATERHGRLDILVNNVGGGWFTKGFEALDDDGWAAMLDLNLLAAVRTTRAALPHLVATRGVVVNVSSVNGRAPDAHIHAYSAAKAALDNLTVGLASEYAAQGVRVVGVAPGPVDTPLWLGDRGAGEMLAALHGGEREEAIERARSGMPFGRFSTAEEVADLIAFLASPRAGTVSGTTLAIDSGATGVV